MNTAKKHGDTMIGLKPAAVYKNLVKSRMQNAEDINKVESWR